jgi:hypothetical protein
MPEDKRIRPDKMEEYRSATTNTQLGLAAYLALKPQVDAKLQQAKEKLIRPKESGSKVELPSGQIRPKKD